MSRGDEQPPLKAKQCRGPTWTHCGAICAYCLKAWKAKLEASK